jgi:DNA (cytosine-5)-methyltransferase 1
LRIVDKLAIVTYAAHPGKFGSVSREVANTLQGRDWKDGQFVNDTQYTVRRLMPEECALCQGFPPDWCAGLETPEPTEADIDWWQSVFETWRQAAKPDTRPKSRKQIAKWLRDPYSEAAEYALWGNGICLPNARFVMAGIVWAVNLSQ